jgi:hypothetical protein
MGTYANHCCYDCEANGFTLAQSQQFHAAVLEYREAVGYERAMRWRMRWIGVPVITVAIAAFLFMIGYSVWTVLS